MSETNPILKTSRWNRAEEADPLGRSLLEAYGQLRRLAQKYLLRERLNHTLQATALVHEAYLRLCRREHGSWQGSSHFFNLAAREMRRTLVDHARRRNSVRRGGGADHLALYEDVVRNEVFGPDTSLLALDESLASLAAQDPRKARIVELRFFGGLTIDESAEVMDVSPRTIVREWQLAKAWIYRDLSKERSKEPAADETR